MMIEDISSLPIEEADYCIVDVETTGLSPRSNGVIEIGLVKVSGMKIVDSYGSFINPGKDIPYFITQLTGITNDDVYDAPFFEDVVGDIADFIGEDILTAHNLSFDSSFLKKEFMYCGREPLTNHGLCTLKLARRMYPMLRSKALGVVCKHLGLKNSNAHRAISDAEVTAKLLIKLIKEVKNFNIKHVNELLNYQSAPKGYEQQVNYKKKLGEDISVLPDAPGIYYFLNAKNEIIYIGKAKSLKNRVKSYFLQTAPKKAKKIIKQSSHLKIELTNTELTALLMEAELIKIVSPRHNVMLKEYGNKYFLRITTTHKFPAVEISNHFDFDGNDYFGLFISRKKAVAVQEMILRTFLIRECTNAEFDKGKSCFLAEIERCTAPCVNKDKSCYFEELEKVYEFLYGKNQFAMNRLLNKMKEYSNSEKYEKAAEVKEVIDMILSQTHKTSLLAEPVNSAKVLFEVSEPFAKDYVLMIAGKIYIKKYAIDDKDYFEEALDDYFSETMNINILPHEEDLEKMKITLNWLIKNRNKARIFYLKDYSSKEELYTNLSSFNKHNNPPEASTFDITNFTTDSND
jgi:DNA polymerase III subunit epsilon